MLFDALCTSATISVARQPLRCGKVKHKASIPRGEPSCLHAKPSHPSLHRWTLPMEQKSHPSSLAGPAGISITLPTFIICYLHYTHYTHYTVTPSCYSCSATLIFAQSRLQLQALKAIQGKEKPGQTWLHFYRMRHGYMTIAWLPLSKTPTPHRPRTLSSVP